MMLLLTLSLVPAPTLAATTPGSVSIWSDSSCGDDDTIAFSEPRAIELNQTLVPDTCHNLPRSGHSYIVDEWALCDDGQEATWYYFDDRDCPGAEGITEVPNASITSAGIELRGLCLALVDFASVGFFCRGLGKGGSGSGAGSGAGSSSVPQPSSVQVTSRSDLVAGPSPTQVIDSSTPTVTSRSDLVISATGTPLIPGSSPTAPLYTILDTSGYTLAPTTGTAAPTGTGVPPTPAPSPFTGGAAAAGRTVPLGIVIVACVFFGMGIGNNLM